MTLSTRLKNAANTFKYFAPKSTVHGLLHIYQSSNPIRQLFWWILLAVGVSLSVYQFYATVDKFADEPVTARLSLMRASSEFPGVTICNMKPISEQLFQQDEVFHYFNSSWKFFNYWMRDFPNKSATESSYDFSERVRQKFQQLLRVLWVSADTRDVSHSDDTMVLYCKFNDFDCTNGKHFFLIQHYIYWNCYTFDRRSVKDNNFHGFIPRGEGDELELILFTDSYNKNHVYGDQNAKSGSAGMQMDFSGSNRFDNYLYYYCPNVILKQRLFEPAGLRIFFHGHRNYPMTSKDFVQIRNARSSTITLNPIQYKLLSREKLECTSPPQEKIKFVRYFNTSDVPITNIYFKGENAHVTEAKQKIVFDKCGCYSHQYAFTSSRAELCYYAPPEQWITPSDALLQRIECHDDAVAAANEKSVELVKAYHGRMPCDFVRYRPSVGSVPWPKPEFITDIWEDLLVPKIKSGVGFLRQDKREHHIYNASKFRDYVSSREQHMYLTLLLTDPSCFKAFSNVRNSTGDAFSYTDMDKLEQSYERLGPCIEEESLARNLARVRIRLPSPWMNTYDESWSYDWTEALSEIGGTFGLWLGVSLLVILELLEILLTVCYSFATDRGVGVAEHITFSVPVD